MINFLLQFDRQTTHKQVGFLCCASGYIDFTINLPHSGFCVNGDHVPLSVAVENGSGCRVRIRAEISKQITFSVKEIIISIKASLHEPVARPFSLTPPTRGAQKISSCQQWNKSIYITDDHH